jgi:hypothetical protein
MKFFPFILLFFGFAIQNLKAQTFEISCEDSVVFEPDLFQYIQTSAIVKNISNTTVHTIVTKEEISVQPGHRCFFNWDLLHHPPSASESYDTIVLAPQEENNSFSSVLDPNGINGTSTIRYCFVDAFNPANRNCIQLRINYGVNSKSEVISGDLPKIVSPTFDSESQSIRIKENAENIKVWNMVGQNMNLDFKLDGHETIANASTLKNGIYILTGNVKNVPFRGSVRVVGN